MNDIYKAYENVLLHFDGTNGSTTITDDAGHTIAVSGNAQISTAQSKFGGSSCYLDGNGDYLTIGSSEIGAIGTDDFTVECWVYLLGASSVDGNGNKQAYIARATDDRFHFLEIVGNTTTTGVGISIWDGTHRFNSPCSISYNAWHHIAQSRVSGVVYTFLDGALIGSSAYNYSLGTTNVSVDIGGSNVASWNRYLYGHIDEFRFIKGYGLYTQSFSVPTSPYVYRNNTSFYMKFDGTNGANTIGAFIEETGKSVSLLYGSPTLSTSQVKNGTTSCYFNGGSGILMTANSAFSFGSGNFTIEFWVWTDPTTGPLTRLLENEQYNVTGGWHFSYNGSDSAGQRRLGFQLGLNGGGGARLESNNAIPTSQWVHIAVVRDGTTISMFVNGIKQSTTLTSSENFTSTKLMMGVALDYSNPFTGYIDSPILLKGVSRYSANFDPSATDYYFGNDIFLTHCDGSNNSTAFVDDVGNIITASGSAKISTAQSKFGGSSGYFDGSNSFLTSNVTPIANQSYTIECWIYPAAYSSDASWGRYVYSQYDNGVDFGNRFILGFPENNSHKLQCFHASGGGNLLSTSDIPLNTWTHIATTYDGSTRRLFVNGVLEASVSTSGASLSTASVRIGCVYFGSNIGFFSGYIDEIRVTKGVARYLTNFNVPFDAFVYLAAGRTYLAFLNDLLICAPSAIAGSVVGKFTQEYPITTPNYYDGGSYKVSGTVEYSGVPASRKVSLFTLKDKRLIAETWSDPVTGAYSFSRLKDQEYFVWSEDYLRVFDPVSHLVPNTAG